MECPTQYHSIMQSHERKREMFVQCVSAVYVPRMGEYPWRFARNEMDMRPGSPTSTQAGNTDQVCLHASQAGRPLGKPTPPFCGPSLPHHRYPCVSPLALVMLKDSPVLRTIFRGLREESAGSLSQTGNISIIIIIISTVKTTSLLGVMLLTFHSTTGIPFTF